MTSIVGAMYDPSTGQYFLDAEKRAEVLGQLKMARPEIQAEVLKKIEQPLCFEIVKYYYYVPRWLKEEGYKIGVFFGDWHPRNLFAKGIHPGTKVIAIRSMTVDEVIDQWTRWRMYGRNYNTWDGLIGDEILVKAPQPFIDHLISVQTNYPLRTPE